MKETERMVIKDTYGLKRYEVYRKNCKLQIFSFDHGRQLTDKEVKSDEELLCILRPLLSFKQRNQSNEIRGKAIQERPEKRLLPLYV